MSRIDAREKAMQLLYQLASQEGSEEEQIKLFLEVRTPLKTQEETEIQAEEDEPTEADEAGKPAYVPLSASDRDYLLALVEGVRSHEKELDALYAPYLVKWTPDRLPKLERMLLRLGTYEIAYAEDIPDSVAINEVVRLTRKYADEDAYSYINAVLGKVSSQVSNEAPREASHEE